MVRETNAPLQVSHPAGSVDIAKAATMPEGKTETADNAAATKAVVAISLLTLFAAGVGAVGVPVKAGLLIGA